MRKEGREHHNGFRHRLVSSSVNVNFQYFYRKNLEKGLSKCDR